MGSDASTRSPAPRQLARYLLAITVLVIIAAVLWRARDALVPYLFGFFVFYLALPLVQAVERRLPNSGRIWRYRRILSTLIVALLLICAALLMVFVLGAPIVNRTRDMIDDVPRYWDQLLADNETFREWYEGIVPEGFQVRLENLLSNVGERAAGGVYAVFSWLLNVTGSLLDTVVAIVLVPLFVVYLLLEEPRQRRNLRRQVPASWNRDAQAVTVLLDRTFGSYVRGVVIVALIIGVITGLAYWIIGVDLWLPLGVIAFFGEIVPIVGPWIAFFVSALVILATEPELFIFAAAVFGIIQAIEGWVLAPRIEGGSVTFSSSQTIVLLAIGGAVGGFVGMVFALPAAAFLRDLVIYIDQRIDGATPQGALDLIERLAEEDDAEPANPVPTEA